MYMGSGRENIYIMEENTYKKITISGKYWKQTWHVEFKICVNFKICVITKYLKANSEN